MTPPRRPIDYAGLNHALLQRVDSLLAEWLPHGVERAGRWYVGDFDGSPGESANVNMRTGQWIDNAGGGDDCGGDLTSLYARIYGLSNHEAALELMRRLGWTREDDDDKPAPSARQATTRSPASAGADRPEPPPAGSTERPLPKRRSMWRAVTPVPDSAPAATFTWAYKDKKADAWVELQAVRHWEYRFNGQLYGHVARFERVSSDGELVKDTLPRTWCVDEGDDRGSMKWHWKQWEAPRPLYVPATLLASDPALVPVVLVEGEKCALAGHELLGHEFDFVSWPGGCKAWALADWSWLAGRVVYLWPDCDSQHERLSKAEREAGADPKSKPLLSAEKQPGLAAMVKIGELLVANHGCTVLLARIPQPGQVADGWDIADAIADGWDAGKVRDFIRASLPFTPPSPEAQAKAATVPTDEDGRPAPDAWRAKLVTVKDRIQACRENVVLALDGDPSRNIPGIPEVAGVIAYNEFLNEVYKLRPPPWGGAAGKWEETDELELGAWLVREHWLPPMARATLEEAVNMVARRHAWHPVRERLERVRGTWDGAKRLPRWLAHCCGGEHEAERSATRAEYLKLAGTWFVMAMCARVLTPGCKFDYMLILESPRQGQGKSTTARVLGGDWFADTGLKLDDKDSFQNLQGIWVYEWAELDSLSKADVRKVKNFVSSDKDRFRASYDRRARDYPRQCVFVGTTNEKHYLTDTTGNRRFWPVSVTRPVDLDWLRANLDQMLAEALHYLAEGRRFWPTAEEQERLFDPEQGLRSVDDPLDGKIRYYLLDDNQRVGIDGRNGAMIPEISLSELLAAVGFSIDKQTTVIARQASAVLSRLGWERVRSSPRKDERGESIRPWVYRRPKRPDYAATPTGDGSTNGATQPHATETADACPF